MIRKRVYLALSIFLIAFVFSIACQASDLTAEALFSKAKALPRNRSSEALLLYCELIEKFPDSDYVAQALLEALSLLSPGIRIYGSIPLFTSDEVFNISEEPLSVGLYGSGVTRFLANTDLPYTSEEIAHMLYTNHRDFLEKQNGLIWTYIYNAGLEEEAYPYLLQKRKEEPANYNVLYNVSKHLLKQGKHEDAIVFIDEYLQQEELFYFLPEVYLMKAWLLLDQDNVIHAYEVAKKAQEMAEKHLDSLSEKPYSQYIGWFLPEDQTTSLKVGVFVNGVPQSDIAVNLSPVRSQSSFGFLTTEEARRTKSDGYTGTFLRSRGDYKINLRFTQEQGLALDKSKYYVQLKGVNAEKIFSFKRSNKIVIPPSYEPGTPIRHLEPCLVVRPGDELLLEFHFLSDIDVQADNAVYNVDESVKLTWDEIPGIDLYRLTIQLESGEKFYLDVKENSVILNEQIFDEITNGRVPISMDPKTGYAKRQSMLGGWRGSLFSVSVNPLGISVPKEEMLELFFQNYLNDQSQPVKEPLILAPNYDSLDDWEKELIDLPIVKAYQRFKELFTQEEILNDKRLSQINLRLEMLYRALRSSVYLDDEIQQKRDEAKELIKKGQFVEAQNIYEKLLISDSSKFYLEAFLCDLVNTHKNLGEAFYPQLTKDPDFQKVISLTSFQELKLEEAILPQVAKTLLEGDYELAESYLEMASPNSVLYEKIIALLNLNQKYRLFID